ncbi:hypothetical protein [Bacillus andreraoultii]|uniref:hypothetical protein n=1 Tax=Bacillus andreraoultii TaxID=1499685 RepID=UPI00053B333B|nr:hypothetical protein [Bacillus andreraoultii]
MSKNLKYGIFSFIYSCILIPLFFLILSLVTGQWGFFLWSLLPSILVGIPCGVVVYNQYKKEILKR